MDEGKKLTLVDQAITSLESLTGSKATPIAVMSWITLHTHINLPMREISMCMQRISQEREESPLER
jgi:hypothetical protein